MEICEDYVKVPLRNKKKEIVEYALISLYDSKEINKYKWHLDFNNYVRGPDKVLMHRFIMNIIEDRKLKPSEIVDHIDHNKLNNTRSNLRIVTSSENNRNKEKQKNCTSNYYGVYFHKETNKWKTQISIKGKSKCFYYYTEKFAAYKYNLLNDEYNFITAQRNKLDNIEDIINEEKIIANKMKEEIIENKNKKKKIVENKEEIIPNNIQKRSDGTYRSRITRNRKSLDKTFKTLQEAINAIEEFLNNNENNESLPKNIIKTSSNKYNLRINRKGKNLNKNYETLEEAIKAKEESEEEEEEESEEEEEEEEESEEEIEEEILPDNIQKYGNRYRLRIQYTIKDTKESIKLDDLYLTLKDAIITKEKFLIEKEQKLNKPKEILRNDKNQCIIKILHKEENFEVIIDENLYQEITKYKWYINNNGYVYGRSSNGHCSLHKTVLLMNNKIIDKDVIDHINRNKLDNRLENLKTVTFQENSRNRTSSINSSVSKYVGVTKRENNKYRSRIEINKKSISLGSFNTAEEAARARDKYVIEQFGVDSCYTLNFPNEY